MAYQFIRYTFLISVILVALITFLAGYIFIQNLNSKLDKNISANSSIVSSKPSTAESSKPIMFDLEKYFVVASNFESKIQDYVTGDNQNNLFKYYSLKGSLPESVCVILNICNQIQYTENYEQLVNILKTDSNNLAVLSLDGLDFRLKALKFKGISIWEDSDKYELKVKQTYAKKYGELDPVSFNSRNLTRVGHTGSFIPARGVMLHTKRKFEGNLEKMIEPMKAYFSRFDILSATQEISLSGDGIYCDTCMSFVGSEKEIPEMLLPLGIDVVTMAANHVLDGGYEALGNTIEKLKAEKIKVIGASVNNNEEALEPVLIEKNGLKIAYIAFNDTPGIEQWATDKKGGAGSFSDWVVEDSITVSYEPNLDRIKRVVNKAKSLNPNFIVVLPHWGSVEYQRISTNYVKKLADLLFAEGVDIIIGDHPHWTQQIEWHKNEGESYSGLTTSPIFYSMGNFVFDQMWSEETRTGMSVELIFYDKKLKAVNLAFHKLDLYNSGTVEPISDTESYNKVLQNVFEVSDL